MTFDLTWIVTGLAIVGVVLNIYKIKWCFVIWSVTNLSWAIVDFNARLFPQAWLFVVYFVLAIVGLYKWFMEDKKK